MSQQYFNHDDTISFQELSDNLNVFIGYDMVALFWIKLYFKREF